MITEADIDGVPALFAPMAGPTRAGLVFRVGRADEGLATSGITHLVEHLALHRHGLSDYHFNGQTGPTVTHFHMQGSETDVVAYLNAVCAGLADLPMDRLATEKSILRTESSKSQRPSLPMWRHGALGYGLVSYPEWGLHRLSPDDVREWADTWFTRGNAVLWVTGSRMPQGLRLNLPAGVRQSTPTPTNAIPQVPAWYAEGEGNLAYQAMVARRAAASFFADVLERAMYRALRLDLGASYTASTSYDPLDATCATITAFADSLPEKQAAMVGEFIDLLASLRVGRINEGDIAAAQAKTREALAQPDIEALRLPSAAMNLLIGAPRKSVAELLAECAAVTQEQVHAVALEAIDNGLLQVPGDCRADWAGFVAAPGVSADTVNGTAYASRMDDSWVLRVAPDGVSMVAPDGIATVRYADCQAMLAWPDGARMLIGSDAIQVRVEPTLWRLLPETVAGIDANVPDQVIIPMPARPAEQIPQPPERPTPAPPVSPKPAPAAPVSAARFNALVGLLLVSACAVAVLGIDLRADAYAGTGVLIAFGISLAVSFVCAVQVRRIQKR